MAGQAGGPLLALDAGIALTRVPVDLVVLMLAQDGIQANARQIRNWRLRGHITRTGDGYDLREIVAYLDARNASRHAA